jgi:class 3 adenylate cyclase
LAWSEDYPSGVQLDAEWDTWLEGWRKNWGAAYAIEHWAPSMAHDELFRLWWAKYLRFGASPNAVIDLFRMSAAIDVRDILSAIHVPTLVVHRARDRAVDIAHGRFLAERIKGAKFVELSGEDHLWWVGDSEAIIHEVQEFLTGERQVEPDRVLATVFFTDIVNSTKRAAMMGDRRWRDLLDNHNTLLAAEIERFGGRVVKSMGDGILATFDSPAQAIQCAQAATREVQKLGIEIRVGLHTGEVELIAGDVGGIVVHTAARVLEKARPNEVWTSRTVKDLVAGSNLKFADRGTHQLKGISGDWPLFAVEP